MAEYVWACDLRRSSCDTTARITGDQPTVFGDGYAQVAPDGLNHVKDMWDVTHSDVDHLVFLDIKAFIRARLNTTPFTWAPPGEDALRSWMCTSFKATPSPSQTWDVTLRFEEWFRP